MKKKLILIGTPVIIVALLLTAILRDPTKSTRFQTLKNARPVSWSISTSFNQTDLRQDYALNLSYDEAVKKLESELAPSGWKHGDSYRVSLFFSPDGDHILVYRTMLLVDFPVAAPTPQVTGPALFVVEDGLHDNVFVQTYRPVSSFEEKQLRLKKWFSGRSKPGIRYWAASPRPRKAGTEYEKVNVSKGTRALESSFADYDVYIAK